MQELLPNRKQVGTGQSEELIAAFEDRFVDPIRVDESRERLVLLFEKGLKSPLAYNETIIMHHDVLRSIFPAMPLVFNGTPYHASEEELVTAGLGCCLRKCLTVTGGGCYMKTPVSLKLLPYSTSKAVKQLSIQSREFKLGSRRVISPEAHNKLKAATYIQNDSFRSQS